MKNRYHFLLLIACSFISSSYSQIVPINNKGLETTGICFTENKGQVRDQNYNARKDVLYSGVDGGMAFHMRSDGLSYQLNEIIEYKTDTIFNRSNYLNGKRNGKIPSKYNSYRIDVKWLNYNKECQIESLEPTEGFNNYYLPSCPDGALEVKSYNKVKYKNIYNKIDLVYYNSQGHLKYDYVVYPGGNYRDIRWKIEGALKIQVTKDGILTITTPLGNIEEKSPVVFQSGKKLKGSWQLKNNIVSFSVNGINPSLPFTIDPLIRFWGTFYGGTDWEVANVCRNDNSGNAYMAGETLSSTTTLIATSGSYQNTFAGDRDGFLVKFNGSGVRLWGTYYGGGNTDSFSGMICDNSNHIYVTGETNSGAAIASSSAFQPNFGGVLDAMLLKFNSSGARIWSTYYGGEDLDGTGRSSSCAVDLAGNIYMSGVTSSTLVSSIATAGSHQPTISVGSEAYLVKFDSTGQRIWGTYYGGINAEYGEGCAVDYLNNVYMVGNTSSPAGISTPGSHQFNQGPFGNNAYLVKFNSSGIRQWGTYYSSSNSSSGLACSTDMSGNIYMVGATSQDTGTGIATIGSHQSAFGGNNENAYLVKFNGAGTRLWGTYYGGNNQTVGYTCTTDKKRNVYLEGYTQSVNCADTIATSNGFKPFFNDFQNNFIAKFDSTGVRKMGTYYGGSNYSFDGCVSVDPNNYIYLCGTTCLETGTVIATNGSQQFTYGGGVWDGYLVKFFDCGSQVDGIIASNGGCYGTSAASATITPNGGGGYTYTWVPTGGNSNIAANLIAGTYTCLINSVCGNTSQTVSIVQPTQAVTTSTNVSDTLICIGQTSTLSVNGTGGMQPYTYIWSNGSTGSTLVQSPTVSTVFTVQVSDVNGCTSTNSITIQVSTCQSIVKHIQTDNTIVWPNPASGIINIALTDYTADFSVELFDVTGRKISQYVLFKGNGKIDISELAKGAYLLKIFEKDHLVITKKILKN